MRTLHPSTVWIIVTVYVLGCESWALTTWGVAVLWRSLAAFLVALLFVWPILVELLHGLAAGPMPEPRGRAATVWMVAQMLTTGTIVPRFVEGMSLGITGSSVLLSSFALLAVHPFLVPLAFVPLVLREGLCAWVTQQLAASAAQGAR